MDYKLKSISLSSIPEAISKAELYRNLNEPEEAESICHDILAIEPENQLAWRILGLAMTDQFRGADADRSGEAERIFQTLTDPYERFYYTGLLHERWAKAQLAAGRPPHMVRVLFERALKCFAEAEKIRPPGNDDAILRWNRCVRLLESHAGAEGEPAELFDAHDSPPI